MKVFYNGKCHATLIIGSAISPTYNMYVRVYKNETWKLSEHEKASTYFQTRPCAPHL